MKIVKLYGEKLKDQFLVAIIGDERASLSIAIQVNFIEDNERKTGKLILHSREMLHYKDINNFIHCFTGTIITDGNRRPCMVSCQTQDLVVEIWMTIIELKYETFTSNISKTEFIKECKEYCKKAGMEIDQDGNLKKGFPLFRNAINDSASQGTIVMKGKDNLVVNTEMYNNLFPIEKDDRVIFGEYIDEHLVRIYSQEEAEISGIMIS